MKNNFEHFLPVGIVMSMYDFTIPTQVPATSLSYTIGRNSPVIDSNSDSEDDEIYDHIAINGEVCWQL